MTRARLRFPTGDPIVFALEDVVAYGPPVTGFGTGEAWVRLADGRELRFPIGDGPHVSLVP